jgi:hypothetical protein
VLQVQMNEYTYFPLNFYMLARGEYLDFSNPFPLPVHLVHLVLMWPVPTTKVPADCELSVFSKMASIYAIVHPIHPVHPVRNA